MKHTSDKRKQLILVRFFFGQLPLLGTLILFLLKDYFSVPSYCKLLLLLTLAVSFMANVYCIWTIKKENLVDRKVSHQRLTQILFILLSLGVGLISLFRAFFASEGYQRVIGFIGAAIAFLLVAGLIWGLKYIK